MGIYLPGSSWMVVQECTACSIFFTILPAFFIVILPAFKQWEPGVCHLLSANVPLIVSNYTLWWQVGFDYRIYTELGQQTLSGHKENLCAPEQRKEQWPQKRLKQTCLWVSRGLQQRHGLVVAFFRVRSTKCNSKELMKEVNYLHYLHHNLFSGKTTGREHSPTHQ